MKYYNVLPIISLILTPFAIQSKFTDIVGWGAMYMPCGPPSDYWTHTINYGVIILQILLLIYYYALRKNSDN